ncbi:MAG: secretin N-terminal domain-containing protein [Verrucomicrobia bacterium]|nr:secretin N-terminal domain-containing protein [Verrucomicrobiota bacterium]
MNARIPLTPLFLAVASLAFSSVARGQEAPASSVASTLAGAGVAEPTANFSFSASGVPIKQALSLFARANNLNIVPDLDVDGEITVDFRDLPLDLAMGALLEANGYYFTREGRLLRVRNRESRLFHIDYIHTTRSGQGSSAVQISSGGGGSGGGGSAGGGSGSGGGSSTEGSSMTVTNTSTINFWGELNEQLKSMISAKGTFTVNSLSGTVLVTDGHRNIETIADYLKTVTENVVRQVDLEIEIYEITLGKSMQLGINWQRIEAGMDTTFNTIPGALTLKSGGGLIVQTPMFGSSPGAAGVQATLQRTNTQAIIDALSQQGELKVISKPRLRTLNNQPSVVRVGQDMPVFITTKTTQSSGTATTTDISESIQTLTVGTVLSITPQVSDDGLITLDITPAVSRLVRMEESATGNTKAPVVDIRQASSIVRVRDGATVVLGGLVQNSTSTTTRKVPFFGSIPILGKLFSGKYDTSERTELIFFVTPHVVNDLATEKSVEAKPVETASQVATQPKKSALKEFTDWATDK